MTNQPPENVQSAARVVATYLESEQQRQLSTEEIARLTPAQKLDYARNFKQDSMPAWRDPRAAK